ncbi:MAG TPA: alcohol dehydrogenase catalytic domain-containing protein [Gemmatimonadaceae bacterium]|nr:alcohol dehydrogenase catalytic domain-containing protein [Gemmatimonadaceae bacterium]
MSRTMRAAVLVDVGRIEVRDVPVAPPAAHEVLVRVEAVGLCGTDLHIVAGHGNYNRDALGRPRPLAEHPQILGHEIAARIVEVGSGVRGGGLAPDTRVVVDQGRTCVSELRTPACEYCVTGDSHQCEYYAEHGITGLPGGFAEYMTVPASNVVPLKSSLDPVLAALAEPLGCVHHSMDVAGRAVARYTLNNADASRRIRTIVIFGAGPAGLLFTQYLRTVAKFDGLLIVSDPSAVKRALAERCGAEAMDPTATDLVEHVAERTRGRRAEFVVEASGAANVFGAIPGVARKQSTILLYGHGHAGADLSLLNPVQFLEPALVAPAGASGGHDANGRPLTYVTALRLLERGDIDVRPLVTHRYNSLDAVPGAFAGDHRRTDYIKGVVMP